jgi:hypothetical protein
VVGTRQAAARLGLTTRQVRRLIEAGKLVATPLGEPPRATLAIDEASLERLVAERASAPPRPGRRKKERSEA